jgi:hypothetical protein
MYSTNAHCVVGSVTRWHPSLFPKSAIKALQTGGIFFAVRPRCEFVRQRLTDAVDLVIVAAIGKGEKLLLQKCEPRRLDGKQHTAILEFYRLYGHASFFVVFGLDRDGRESRIFQFRYKGRSDAGIFN